VESSKPLTLYAAALYGGLAIPNPILPNGWTNFTGKIICGAHDVAIVDLGFPI